MKQITTPQTDGATAKVLCTGCRLALPTWPTHLGAELCAFCIQELAKRKLSTFSDEIHKWSDEQIARTVRAVNLFSAHEALAEAAKRIPQWLGRAMAEKAFDGCCGSPDGDISRFEAALATLKKARGE